MKPVFKALTLALSLAVIPPTIAQTPEEGRRPPEGERRPEGERPRDGERRQGDERPPEGRRPEGPRPEGRRPGMLMPPGPGGFGGPGGFAGRFPNPLLNALDKDGDGQLSEEEIDLAVASLKTLDRNRDRRLDASELRPNFPGQAPQGAPGTPTPQGNPGAMLERLSGMDRNGDGKLSRDELPEPFQPMVERFDRNTDGALDREELTNLVRERMATQGDPAQLAAQMLRRADANSDGKLSGEEIPPFMRDRLESLDKNSDGALDLAELQTMTGNQRPMPVPAPESGTIRPRRPKGGDRPGRGERGPDAARLEGRGPGDRPARPLFQPDAGSEERPQERNGEPAEKDSAAEKDPAKDTPEAGGDKPDADGDKPDSSDREEKDGEGDRDREEKDNDDRRDQDQPAEPKSE